jgi:murein DD-endopeptidase MepM/ murein hydrolase activator NlpD
MIKTNIFICFYIAFLLNTAQAQYINTDSLHVLEGSPLPISIAELDSIEMHSPEVLPEYFTGGFITSGYLLSQFSLPAKGKVISRFGPRSGRMHTGTDIKMNKGDTIYAAFDGQVTMSKYYYGYGNMVVLDHGNNIETYYSHLSKCLVNTGRFVKIGDPVGLAGATGRATTSHLHFEIRENNKPYNSELVFDFENGKTREEIAAVNSLASLHKEVKAKSNSVNQLQSGSQKYVVRAGDSLYKIARYSKTTIQSLCMLNNLTENSILQIGQVLHLY